MNKQELIKKYEGLFEKLYAFPVVTINEVLEDLKQLDEPQKPVVPQFVADWIEEAMMKRVSVTLTDDLFIHLEALRMYYGYNSRAEVTRRAWMIQLVSVHQAQYLMLMYQELEK